MKTRRSIALGLYDVICKGKKDYTIIANCVDAIIDIAKEELKAEILDKKNSPGNV